MKLLGKTISDLLELIKKKEVSEHELFEYFKKRIEKHDPALNCFVKKTDTERVSGIPLAIKDNFCTKGLPTTASSKILEEFIPPYDATVIKKLKEASYSVIGKTNMDAWAHGSSTETSDFGPTKNPYDLSRVAGGSSGGSAAAVAAYLTPAAIGSETAGSIRQPAAWSGVVGLKPTYGRVSRYGLIAMASSFDCPGTLTRDVSDAALILQILAGVDKYDATAEARSVPDYLINLKQNKKFTIGLSEEYFENVDDEVVSGVHQCIDTLKKAGHEVKKIKLLNPKYALSVYTIIQRAEVSSNLARYDGVRFGLERSFFGEEAKKRIMLGAFTLLHGYYDVYYKKAQEIRQKFKQDFQDAFKNVDFIIAPTTPTTALKLGEFEKYPFFGEVMDILAEPASIAGLPAINLPVSLDGKGLPVGIQIMGKWFDEENLLNLAYQIEDENHFDMLKVLKNYE